MSMFPWAGGAVAIAALAAAPVLAAEAPSPEVAQAAVALVSDGVAARAEADPACPKVVVAPDGGVFPKRDDNYKATVEALARDCANLGAETILKVAVVGEGARDTKDGPSWFAAPLRVSVKDAEGHSIETRKIRVRVEMPTGVQKVSFNHLEENVSLPPAPEGGYRDWTVTVGFDPAASEAASKRIVAKPAKAARAAAVKRATIVARAPARVAPLPPQAGAPAFGAKPQSVDMRSQFQKLADANKERRTSERDAAQVAQRQRQLQEQAKARAAQAQARNPSQTRAEAQTAQPKAVTVQTRIPAAPQPQIRTASSSTR
jgi:hypothetical protein